jgi:hypothetical protein
MGAKAFPDDINRATYSVHARQRSFAVLPTIRSLPFRTNISNNNSNDI